MSYESDFKITFYNREDNERLSDQYSEFLMINRDGEVFELVHNGRGEYSPSYEGDWIGYKVKGNSKADECEAKAKAFDRITDEVKLTKFDIFEKELIDEDTGYLALGKELARFVTKYERIESDEV